MIVVMTKEEITVKAKYLGLSVRVNGILLKVFSDYKVFQFEDAIVITNGENEVINIIDFKTIIKTFVLNGTK